MSKDLAEMARRARMHILRMTNAGGSSHIGAAYSCIDILVTLYSAVMNVDPKKPRKEDRDRFVLSKGHAGVAIYATLAECGFMPVEKLSGHYQDGSDLCGHVSHKGIPGVELSTGSLGHGVGVACGLAKAAKMKKQNHRVFTLLSDGECDEGSVWEALLFAAQHKLDNFVVIIDYNKIQSLAPVAETIGLEPITDKFESFGAHVINVNGHDYDDLQDKLSSAPEATGKPTVVIAHTTKGKGVSFMENSVLWHYRCPRGEEFDAALAELEAAQ